MLDSLSSVRSVLVTIIRIFNADSKPQRPGGQKSSWPKDRQLGARSEPKLLVGNIYFFTDVTFPVHCMVGDWKQWGECSVTCGGDGTKTRAREVVQEPANGGAQCPDLEETETCNSDQCPGAFIPQRGGKICSKSCKIISRQQKHLSKH